MECTLASVDVQSMELIVTGESSRSDQWQWNVICFVLEIFKCSTVESDPRSISEMARF